MQTMRSSVVQSIVQPPPNVLHHVNLEFSTWNHVKTAEIRSRSITIEKKRIALCIPKKLTRLHTGANVASPFWPPIKTWLALPRKSGWRICNDLYHSIALLSFPPPTNWLNVPVLEVSTETISSDNNFLTWAMRCQVDYWFCTRETWNTKGPNSTREPEIPSNRVQLQCTDLRLYHQSLGIPCIVQSIAFGQTQCQYWNRLQPLHLQMRLAEEWAPQMRHSASSSIFLFFLLLFLFLGKFLCGSSNKLSSKQKEKASYTKRNRIKKQTKKETHKLNKHKNKLRKS